jgi:hypothetical protein
MKIMNYDDSHLSDQRLLMDVDGELSPNDEKLVRTHLDACWKCRARRQELENAIADFVRGYQREFDAKLPPVAGPRALLKARLAELSSTPRASEFLSTRRFTWELAAAVSAVAVVSLLLLLSNVGGRKSESIEQVPVVSIPDSKLTPGAAVLEDRQAVCAEANTKNKAVPVALQKRVFEEYGIKGAEPRAYEVDYLVTPALGGADDIHNLWPHSYSATAWNAQVKDALEDRLRDLVCNGNLDLTEAQREIASNWIGAYKKYFHTDRPLPEHSKQSIQ